MPAFAKEQRPWSLSPRSIQCLCAYFFVRQVDDFYTVYRLIHKKMAVYYHYYFYVYIFI